MNDGKRQCAGALMLWFVVTCKGAGNGANGWTGVGATDVEGIGVNAAAVAIRGGGIEGASSVDKAGRVIGVVVAAAAAFDDSIGIGGAGAIKDVVEVAVAVAVIECAGGRFGIEGRGGIDDAGVGKGSNGNGNRVKVAVAVSIAVSGCIRAIVAEIQVLQGVSDVGGNGLGTVGVEGVQ